MKLLSLKHYRDIPESERLRRIGELIATAVIRFYRDERSKAAAQKAAKGEFQKILEPADLVSDEIEKQMLRYLTRVGRATPRDFKIALGVSQMTITRRLARLRTAGLLTVAGKRRAARNELADGLHS
jgi:predicted HTH transcriptional regulator